MLSKIGCDGVTEAACIEISAGFLAYGKISSFLTKAYK